LGELSTQTVDMFLFTTSAKNSLKKCPKIKLGAVLQLDLQKEPIDISKAYEMVGVLSFGRGLFRRETIENGNTSYKYFLRLSSEHVVMSQLFGWEGALALSSDDFEGCYVSPQFPTFLCDQTRLNRNFLGWVMQQPSFWDDLGSRAKGMGDRRRTLNPDSLFASHTPLPPIDEQKSIVARLNQLADKVQQVNEHLDAVDEVAAALLISLHHKFAADRIVRLGDIIELFEESVSIKPDGKYPQVGVRGFGGGLFAKAALAGTETSYRAFNRLYADAIVLSQVKGWEGALAVCPPELSGMFVSPEYRTFCCKPSLASSYYLGELIRTPWFWSLLQAATRGVGARRERTRPEQFLNIELPMPELDKQLKVVEILSRQNELKQRHAKIREANQALIPATLEQIFQ
jgi:type I restriction enzyme S subunit